MKKKILMSLSQIFILIIGIFAIGYALGSEVRVVKAYDNTGTCFYAPAIEKVGDYGLYSPQDTSPATKKYYKTVNNKEVLDRQETVPISNPDKYYKNNNKHIWADVYGAYYLAKDKSGQWYYWYIYKNEYDTNNKWTKVSVEERPVKECTDYFNKKEKEKEEENQLTKTCSELGGIKCSEGKICDTETINAKDGTCCLGTCEEKKVVTPETDCKTQCQTEWGRETGTCEDVPNTGICANGFNSLGGAYCGYNGECCCSTEVLKNSEKDDTSSTNGAPINPSDLISGITGPYCASECKKKTYTENGEQKKYATGICKKVKPGTAPTCETNELRLSTPSGLCTAYSSQECCCSKTTPEVKTEDEDTCKQECKKKGYNFGYQRLTPVNKADYCYSAGEKKLDSWKGDGACCCSNKQTEKDKDKTTEEYKEAPIFGGTDWWAYLIGNVVEGAAWATAVWGGIQALKAVLPEDYQDLADTYADTLFGAILAGKTVTGALEAFIPGWRAVEGGPTIGTAGWIGIGAAAAYFLFAFRYESYEVVTFECIPWDAATSTSNEDHCNECNNQGILPCSEYQCRSLGQGCELLNRGTDQEKCAWVNRGDVTFPTIEPWEDALINENYVYDPDNTISPPDRGVRIQYTQAQPSQCIPAFAPLSFGIKLTNENGDPEPAKCKLDTTRKDSFDDMRFYFSDGLLLEEHSYTLSMPGAGGDIETENDGEYSIYVRCQDANGNVNTANFVFNFCVQQGPDTTPPLIVQTSIPNGMPIAYEQTSVDLDVYINEPVTDCRWSHQDQGYENMDGEMDCTRGDNLNDANNQGLYTCETTLDGLKDREENKFYFRCEDTAGNINRESYEFTLIGTQPLVINWVKPENESIIKDSTEAVKVTLEAQTSAGYDDGKSNCYYSDTGDSDDYVLFFSDGNYNNYQHSQDLYLRESEEGENYEYYIKCVDLGGNYDVEVINFEVESDSEPPIVVRAYHEDTYLKIITNEAARCVYDTKYENYPCDYAFEDGTTMNSLEDTSHYTDWNPQETFYIRCQDEYGTQPDPDECSIIVRPSDLY